MDTINDQHALNVYVLLEGDNFDFVLMPLDEGTKSAFERIIAQSELHQWHYQNRDQSDLTSPVTSLHFALGNYEAARVAFAKDYHNAEPVDYDSAVRVHLELPPGNGAVINALWDAGNDHVLQLDAGSTREQLRLTRGTFCGLNVT